MNTAPHPFRTAVEARDLDAIARTLSDNIVLWSPLAFQPFRGKATVMRLLEVLMTKVFEDFVYTDELTADDGTHALIFSTRVGDRQVQGLDLLRSDGDGLIDDFTVMVRPATALEALGTAVGAHYTFIVGTG